MKIFLDSADLGDMESAYKSGVLGGITTNPMSIRGQTDDSAVRHLKKISQFVEDRGLDVSLHAQVMTLDPEKVVAQAQKIAGELDSKNLVVKIPCSWDNLTAVRRLSGEGITVNCTAVVAAGQALMASAAGARYVSLLASRMEEAGINIPETIATVVPTLDDAGAEIIVENIRPTHNITDFAQAGAHVAALPLHLLTSISDHKKSAEVADSFSEYFIRL
ncbi:transaldolase family protein [Streptomyces sp. Wh19]|uniref:transaldolase family protein n=1 Tax=Streptomyces sp. Wh19 TaxID=3076629 RepID=UPI0029586AFB|nr:transaldolase family protein [Streptomyces sp. Wh19]MDV9194453.1 transaldolase family protein [Streptomyces sp. Wh19]